MPFRPIPRRAQPAGPRGQFLILRLNLLSFFSLFLFSGLCLVTLLGLAPATMAQAPAAPALTAIAGDGQVVLSRRGHQL